MASAREAAPEREDQNDGPPDVQSVDDSERIDVGYAECEGEPEEPDIRDECPGRADGVGEADGYGDPHSNEQDLPSNAPAAAGATGRQPSPAGAAPGTGACQGAQREVEKRLSGQVVCDKSPQKPKCSGDEVVHRRSKLVVGIGVGIVGTTAGSAFVDLLEDGSHATPPE